MKICDIVYNSIWYDPRVLKQLRSYKSNNIDTIAIGIKDDRYNESKMSIIDAPYALIESSKSRFKIFRLIKNIKLLKKEILHSNADVVHGNDILGVLPAFLAKRRKKNLILIYDSHEICAYNYGAKGSVKSKLVKFLEKKIIKKVDIFISVSNSSMEYFKRVYNINTALVITNSVEKSRIVNKESYSIHNENSVKIINHGSIVKHRGYDVLLNAAMKDTNKSHLYIIRGNGPLRKKLEEIKIENSVNNFIIEDSVIISEVIPLASKCDIGVAITDSINLNFKNSVSNKLFEYAAAGLPIIMSNIPEHVYLNDKYHFGIVIDNNTADEVIKAVNKLSLDKALYRSCVSGSVLMSKELNWDSQFDNLIVLEKKILTKRQ